MLSKPYFSNLLNLVNANNCYKWSVFPMFNIYYYFHCFFTSTIKIVPIQTILHQFKLFCTSSNYFAPVQTILSQFKNKLFQSKNWTTTYTIIIIMLISFLRKRWQMRCKKSWVFLEVLLVRQKWRWIIFKLHYKHKSSFLHFDIV